jgi:hypothetical protein
MKANKALPGFVLFTIIAINLFADSLSPIASNELENIFKVGDVYIVHVSEISIYSITDNAKITLTNSDTIRVLEIQNDGLCKIKYSNGKTGFVAYETLLRGAHKLAGETLMQQISDYLIRILDFRRISSWIMVFIFVVILILFNFNYINKLLVGNHKNNNEFHEEVKPPDISVSTTNDLLPKTQITKRFRWYPLLSGGLLGAAIFIGSVWNVNETQWFFTQCFKIFPTEYTLTIHWFLLVTCIFAIFLTLTWIIESFLIAGPIGGLLRIFLLVLFNFMSLMVVYFLLIPIVLMGIMMFVYRLFKPQKRNMTLV